MAGAPRRDSLPRHMTSVGKERAAVVVITLLLLGTEPDVPRVAAAAVAIVLFWWFIGWSHRRPPDARSERA